MVAKDSEIGLLKAERDDLARQLELRTAELRDAVSEIDRFCHSVSHDLQSPLRAINGFSRILLDECAGKLEGEAADYLQRIGAASSKMSDLIEGLLRLSRVACRPLNVQPVNLSGLAQSVMTDLAAMHAGRNVAVVIQSELCTQGDAKLLRIVLENVLGNAWKFTRAREAAHVEFGCKKIDGRCAYFVRDNGAGFDMEFAESLFLPFCRMHSESEWTGSGVGLAVARRIVARHGGAMWAESTLGEGATFFFTLNENRSV
jgi:light-regulated signal transduction histidine kinase (bacteriophytochrome)